MRIHLPFIVTLFTFLTVEGGWVLDTLRVAENTFKVTGEEIREWVKDEGKFDRVCSGKLPTGKGDMTWGEKVEVTTQFLLGKHAVEPVVGSVVRCRLGPELDMLDHSGIYVGGNRIIHRDGEGKIAEVTPDEFMARLDGKNSATTIFVVCDVEGRPIGKAIYAERAREFLRSGITGYSLLHKNCHQFCQRCIGYNVEDQKVANNFTFSELRDALAWQHYDRSQVSLGTRIFPTQLLIWYTTNAGVKRRIDDSTER